MKLSVTIGSLLYVFGSCEGHSEPTKEKCIPLRPIPNGRQSVLVDRLVGLVVKASASRAEDPGIESRLRRNFFGVESYQ